MKAVVLLSGGLDSATALAYAQAHNYGCYALTANYGQRHDAELAAAARVADACEVQAHTVVDMTFLRDLAKSALTFDSVVPKDRTPAEMSDGIPVTYVPARNTVLLSIALSWAESIGADAIFTGFNVLDASGYPDCRQQFVSAFNQVSIVGTKRGVECNPILVHAPLVHMTKAQIIRLGFQFGVDYSLTHSCYDPVARGGWLACGRCDSCQLRRKGFEESLLPDPTRYA